MNSRAITPIAFLGVLTFLVAGIATSLWHAERLGQRAEDAWADKARLDAARLSDGVFFWVSKAEVNLRAAAGLLGGSNALTPEDFFLAVEEAETWDPEVRFNAVVYARRLLREQRADFEAATGLTLRDANDPNAEAAERFESFAVTHSSDPDGQLGIGVDLASHLQMRRVVTSARQLPGDVVLGPAFRGTDGGIYALIATASDLGGGDGVMAATIDLREFFESLSLTQLPPGVSVRLIERDTEAGEQIVNRAVIGDVVAPSNVKLTEVIRITQGQANWSLNWDFDEAYLNGPGDDAVILVQVGGSLVTVLIAFMLGFLAIENIRFHRQVNEKTAQLSQNSMIVQLTMDTIDQGFAVWNNDHRLVVWSKRCEEFWYHPTTLLRPGLHMRELLSHLKDNGAFGEDDVDLDLELARIMSAGTSSNDRFEMTDGRIVHVRRFPLERGGYVSVYTDVSEQTEQNRALEEERAKAIQASLSKSDFVSNLSHELRDPLNSIIGYSDLLLTSETENLTDRMRRMLSIVNRSGRHLHDLINGILDLSKIESGVFELEETTFRLTDLLSDVEKIVSMRAQENSTILVIENAIGSETSIRADRLRLKQLLINITGNAVKFTRDGTVTLSVLNSERGIKISVEDTGLGIPADDLPMITEPFVQVKRGDEEGPIGTGLGLAIAKRIAALHGIEMSIDSIENEGTTVTLIVPSGRVA